jgi:hypothetical protein
MSIPIKRRPRAFAATAVVPMSRVCRQDEVLLTAVIKS